MDLKIRHANINDINEIYEIELQCFDDSKRFDKKLFYFFLHKKYDEIFLVAELDEDSIPIIAGFIVAFLKSEGNFEIITLNVLEKYRRKKIGTKLMFEVEQIIRQNMKSLFKSNEILIELMVFEKNFPAIKLYEKMGYVKQKIIPNYYQKSKSGIKMVKKLLLNH